MRRRFADNLVIDLGLRRTQRGFCGFAALAVLLAVVGGTAVAAPVVGQESAADEVRIVARKLADGRVELGLQQRGDEGVWGETRLPRARLLPTTAQVGRWLSSSPLPAGAGEVRIAARRLDDGRVEIGLQQRESGGSWSDRRLPRARFLLATVRAGRWLAGSPLSIGSLSHSQPAGPHEVAARELLARHVGAGTGDFSLESSERVRWRDASLGCPQPGYAYAQVETPGYRLVFEFDGTPYEVHTNEGGSRAVICTGGR